MPKFAAGFAAAANGTGAEAHNDTCRCTVQGHGGEGFLVNAYPNTNLYDPNTVIPAVRYDVPRRRPSLPPQWRAGTNNSLGPLWEGLRP